VYDARAGTDSQHAGVGVPESPAEVHRQARQVAYGIQPAGGGAHTGRLDVQGAVVV